MDHVFVAVDLGGESGRVIAARVDADGIHLDERRRFRTAPDPRRDPLTWDVEAIHETILDGLELTPEATSIGIDGWGVDFGLLGADDALVAPPRCYRDSATAGILPALFERVEPHSLFARTGIQMMEINTLCQLLALRLRDAPELRQARRLLLIPDLLLHWLGADARCERTNASTTQMLDCDGRWADDILAACDVPGELLAPVVEAGVRRGVLEGPRVARLGPRTADLVGVASHDTAAAVVATPLPADGTSVFISSGTWSLVGTEVRRPVLSDAALQANLSNEHGVAGTTRLLRNVMGLWLLQECRRSFATEDGTALGYAELVQLAERGRAFTAVVNPDEPAFLRPGDVPGATARACLASGQPPPADRGELLLVLMHSLALRYRWTIDALAHATGRVFTGINIVGGGSRNRLLCQLTADATGLPVTAGPAEATAMGNVIVQAITAGVIADVAEGRRLVAATGGLHSYTPRRDERWELGYERFCSLPGVGSPVPDPR